LALYLPRVRSSDLFGGVLVAMAIVMFKFLDGDGFFSH